MAAIMTPPTGYLAARFGRKRLFLAAVAGFTLASMMCGAATSLTEIVVFRLLQGAFGAGLIPLSQAILLDSYPRERHGAAMALWGLGVIVGPVIGPTLGGYLTEYQNWRWVFYINLPVGIVALVMMKLFVFDPSYIRRQATRVDWTGISLLALGIGALQILLDKGQEDDWFASDFMTSLAVVSAVALAAFLVHELRVANPVVDLRAFGNVTYATGVFLMTMVGFVLFGSLVLLPILLQTLLGYPALQAGIALAPRGIGSFLAMPLVGILLGRIDARRLLALGVVGGSVTLFWLGELDLSARYWDVFWPQFLQGISLALLFVPLTTITMDPIPREKMGNATSIFNLMRNIGGSMGIATATTLLARRQQTFFNILGAHADPYSLETRALLEQLRDAFLARGSDLVTATRQAQAALFGLVQRQAAMLSFNDVFRVLGALFVVLLPLLFLMKTPRTGRGPSGTH
jgi:DHA2 family multidrug resistance protein